MAAWENCITTVGFKKSRSCELHTRSGDMHDRNDGSVISFFPIFFPHYQICTFFHDAEQTTHSVFYRAA
jgi:hypothetical protein